MRTSLYGLNSKSGLRCMKVVPREIVVTRPRLVKAVKGIESVRYCRWTRCGWDLCHRCRSRNTNWPLVSSHDRRCSPLPTSKASASCCKHETVCSLPSTASACTPKRPNCLLMSASKSTPLLPTTAIHPKAGRVDVHIVFTVVGHRIVRIPIDFAAQKIGLYRDQIPTIASGSAPPRKSRCPHRAGQNRISGARPVEMRKGVQIPVVLLFAKTDAVTFEIIGGVAETGCCRSSAGPAVPDAADQRGY